jgi:tyrosyl-tRNA synthetase
MNRAASSAPVPPEPGRQRPVDEQLALIRRGAAEIIAEPELRHKLERAVRTATPLLVKLGLDPTAPDLHLGHTVVLQKLRDFQLLGHQVIIIIGDFTGMIGDPSGRSETRKPLSRQEILDNAETYRGQLGKILDMGRTRVEFNSSWLGALGFEQVIREAAHLTVAQMLKRDDFARRYADGRPITLHEFLYPIAQGYDSVALQADVELGGTDQTFNLLVGRDLQRAHGQEPQVALTVPILEGLDGAQKMSKSFGNYVGIAEPPAEIFGKLMSVPDALTFRYFELATRISETELATLRGLHPMEAKKRLAFQVTAMYHGSAAAEAAQAGFVRVFQDREIPENVDEVTVQADGGGLLLPVALARAGLVPSNSEGRRMVQQGAVEVDGHRVSDTGATLVAGGRYLVRVGKRRFRRLLVSDSGRVSSPRGDRA